MISLVAVALAAAAPSPSLPTYDPAKVAIPRDAREDTGAIVRRKGECITLRSFGRIEGQSISPIWPTGTTIAGQTIRMPDGAPVRIGRKLGLGGRFAKADETPPAAARRCPGRPFYVQRAHQMFLWDDTREAVAMADAVLVVRVDTLTSKDPRGDGMLTTIDATVLSRLAGTGYRHGQPLKLRFSSGIGADGRWQNSVHDPIYGPTGGLKRDVRGERWLLFINQEFYAEQARVRGGKPEPGHVGGSWFYRLDGGKIINDGDSPMAATLAEIRAAARHRRP